jgi:hypothetical protein
VDQIQFQNISGSLQQAKRWRYLPSCSRDFSVDGFERRRPLDCIIAVLALILVSPLMVFIGFLMNLDFSRSTGFISQTANNSNLLSRTAEFSA